MAAEHSIESSEVDTKNPTLLKQAVHKHKASSKRGILERLFTLSFKGFVYPQIWEDPEVDLDAMAIDSGTRIMTIASGGCNIMNYLTEGPEKVKAIDLNPAHVALTRLKLAAAKHLPDYESFFMFFGHADDRKNIENYEQYIAPHLDDFTRSYWESRSLTNGRRINYFRKNLYQFGLLGRFIGMVHFLSKIYGTDPSEILTAKTKKEQKEIFDRTLGPLFEKKFVKFLCNMPISLYGLGIPPSQFDALMESADGDMAALLKARLERLACDFPIQDNYFAWQAFGRGYDREFKKAVPRYLTEENYKKIKNATDRVEVHHTTITEFLQSQPVESFDCYVFLDAQDWMNAAQLKTLWREVGRTARPGARVIFRTAGEESPLTQALPKDILDLWSYDPKSSPKAVAQDRSSIYGGFHVYTLTDKAEKDSKPKKTTQKKAA